MEIKGDKVGIDGGPSCRKLLESGFELYLRRGNMDPPQVDPETGTVFVTIVQMQCIPVRSPALVLRDPVEAMVWSNVPAMMWEEEARAGDRNLINTYADKLAEKSIEMLRERVPGAVK